MGSNPARHRAGLVLVAGSLVLVSGCARPVEVAPPAPTGSAAAACERFTEALPDILSTVGARREVTPATPWTAAYGDPPVSVRCGVPTPETLSATSQLVVVDGVDWFPEQLTGGWMMTSTGLVANVEITVPTEAGPAPSVAADLSPTIKATLPAQ